MLVIILHSPARLLLQTLNIMFHIRNLLPIRLDLIHAPTQTSSAIYPMTRPSSILGTWKREGMKHTAASELLPSSLFQWPLPSFCLFNWSSLWWSIVALRSSASTSVIPIDQFLTHSFLPILHFSFPHARRKTELRKKEQKNKGRTLTVVRLA